MLETATDILQNCRYLQPDERLALSTLHDQVISVAGGIVYAVMGENDYILTAGDRLAIAAGEPVRAWNAGDHTVRLALSARTERLAAAA